MVALARISSVMTPAFSGDAIRPAAGFAERTADKPVVTHHRQYIGATEIHLGRQVKAEGDEPILSGSKQMAIEINLSNVEMRFLTRLKHRACGQKVFGVKNRPFHDPFTRLAHRVQI